MSRNILMLVCIVIFVISVKIASVEHTRSIKSKFISQEDEKDIYFGTLMGKDENWNIVTKNGGKLRLWLPTIKRTPENKDKILPIDPKFLDLCKKLNDKQVAVEARKGTIVIGTEKGIFVLTIVEIEKLNNPPKKEE